MSLIITIKNTSDEVLLVGQVHEVLMGDNGELTYWLTKIHMPLSTHLYPSSLVKGADAPLSPQPTPLRSVSGFDDVGIDSVNLT